jgi:hypothetical protein
MEGSGQQRWLQVVIILGVVYCLDGVMFGMIAGWATSPQMRTVWRLAAWVTSAAVFAAHIWYEHVRLGNSPRTTALHASLAAALGSFGLALAANINAQFVASSNQTLLALALVAWPLLTAVPAFVVGLALATVLARFRKRVAN